MKAAAALAAALASMSAHAWTPPANPDPQKILGEAREDRVAKRYDDALRKHLWFHKEALKHEPALSGVRLSYALDDWVHLGSKHPPALAALRKLRDETAEDVLAGRDARNAFNDLAAMNRELDEHAHTQRLFHQIEARDSAMAMALGRAALDALIETRDFSRAAKYLDLPRQEDTILDAYRHIAANAPFPEARALGDKFLASQAGRVVAVLVLGGRREEALRMWAAARGATDSKDVHATLDRALAGEVPPPLVTPAQKRELRATMP